MNRLTRYALGLLVEEMGEALQIIGKWLRFGDGRGPEGAPYFGKNARELLPTELGDVRAAMDYGERARVVDGAAMRRREREKSAKLLNPLSRDTEGKRLAPDPNSGDE
jgi:hypothetical protein